MLSQRGPAHAPVRSAGPRPPATRRAEETNSASAAPAGSHARPRLWAHILPTCPSPLRARLPPFRRSTGASTLSPSGRALMRNRLRQSDTPCRTKGCTRPAILLRTIHAARGPNRRARDSRATACPARPVSHQSSAAQSGRPRSPPGRRMRRKRAAVLWPKTGEPVRRHR